jgi:dUTP pyrophosphatase
MKVDKIYVDIKLETISKLVPTYSTKGSAGFDIRANIENPITLMPLERVLIPTGLYLEIPEGYEAQVRPRSGLALKKGLTVLNSPGTIDSDYRGEVGVVIVNLSNYIQTIAPETRIAQIVFAKYSKATLIPVLVFDSDDSLNERRDKGFGSTGLK